MGMGMLGAGCRPDPSPATLGFQHPEILDDALVGHYPPCPTIPCWLRTERIEDTDRVGSILWHEGCPPGSGFLVRMSRQVAWAELYTEEEWRAPSGWLAIVFVMALSVGWVCCVLPSLGFGRCFAQEFLTPPCQHLIGPDVTEAQRVEA